MRVFGYEVSKKIQNKALKAAWNHTIETGGFTRQQLIGNLMLLGVPERDDIVWRTSDRLLKKWKHEYKFIYNKVFHKWKFKGTTKINTRKDEL